MKYCFGSGDKKPSTMLREINKHVIKNTEKNTPYYSWVWLRDMKRRVGQQISPWSCVPSSLEIMNYLWWGVDNAGPIGQEAMREVDGKLWSSNEHGHLFYLMPHNAETISKMYIAMKMKVANSFNKKELKLSNITYKYKTPRYGWIFHFSSFAKPGEVSNSPHHHAMVLLGVNNGKVSFMCPAYSRNKLMKKPLIFTYKNWAAVMRMNPNTVYFVTPAI